MKVDGITLLQMIKDEKVKENTLIEVSGGVRTHYPYVKFGENKRLYWENEHYTINQVVLTDDLLEYTFEIIEEKEKPKEIELLNIECDDKHQNYYIVNECGTKCFLTKHSKMIAEQQNEIAKAVNYLLKKVEDKYE